MSDIWKDSWQNLSCLSLGISLKYVSIEPIANNFYLFIYEILYNIFSATEALEIK